MKLKKKIKTALCSVSFVAMVAAGIDVNNNMTKVMNKVAALSREVEAKEQTVEELKESNEALQQQLAEVNEKLGSVEKEINDKN